MNPTGQALQQLQNNQNPSLVQGQQIFKNILSRTQQEIADENQQQDQSPMQPNDKASIAQAMAQLDKEGKSDIAQHGQALDGHEFDGLCEKYAEQQITGHSGIYPSAIAAYQANAQQGNISTSSDNIPKGAQVFFNADNSNSGFGVVVMLDLLDSYIVIVMIIALVDIEKNW
jgi:hypothetical protein